MSHVYFLLIKDFLSAINLKNNLSINRKSFSAVSLEIYLSLTVKTSTALTSSNEPIA